MLVALAAFVCDSPHRDSFLILYRMALAKLTVLAPLLSVRRCSMPLVFAAGAVPERGDSYFDPLHGVHFCPNERR